MGAAGAAAGGRLRGREGSPKRSHAVKPLLLGAGGKAQREKHVGALKVQAGEGQERER